MTSRGRIEAALAHRTPDRTPMFEYCLQSPVADMLLGRPYSGLGVSAAMVREQGWEGAVRQCACDLLDIAELLGHDMLCVRSIARPQDPAAPPVASEEAPPAEPVDAVKRRNESAARARSMAPDTPQDDESLLIFACVREEMQRRGMDLPILGSAYALGVWTDVDLMQTMLLAPEVAHEHFALAAGSALAAVEQYIAIGIDLVGVGGDFSGTRPLISPECYREFIVPRVREVSRRVHEGGMTAINASDGDLWPVIDDFLFGCEVDGYIEIDQFAGMDLRRLKAYCGDRITFFGNLDCGNTLSFGSPADVRRHTIECIEAGMGEGGHVLCASNAITASVPLENYVAVVDAYREVFGLPRLAPRLRG